LQIGKWSQLRSGKCYCANVDLYLFSFSGDPERKFILNADDADGRGSSRINPEKIGVNPQYPRHPRSINPHADVKTALRPVYFFPPEFAASRPFQP
jgi:hypothetical protein